MKIVVFGLGYVGLANAVMLAKRNKVVAIDIDRSKVEAINSRISPIRDAEIERAFELDGLDLRATTDARPEVTDADFVLLATPTDYDTKTSYFNTSSIDSIVDQLATWGYNGSVVVKSTVPVGYTDSLQDSYPMLTILFSPEFLREGKALYDNLHPSRVVVAGPPEQAKVFSGLLVSGALDEDVPVVISGRTEAEAIKLFANTYLAMRVAFFNELDTFAQVHGMNVRQIIEGVSLDPRIGHHYNNPSFGYGGYCLPKDSKQLLANYREIPQSLIRATVESNHTRIEFIAREILATAPEVVGIYRLSMKANSDNFRESAVMEVAKIVLSHGIKVKVFEPDLNVSGLQGLELVDDLGEFKQVSSIIVSNRLTPDLKDVSNKVFTRDVFGVN